MLCLFLGHSARYCLLLLECVFVYHIWIRLCVCFCVFLLFTFSKIWHIFVHFFTFSLFLLRTLHSLAQIIHYFKYGSKIYNNYQYFVVAALPCSIPIVAKCMQYSTIHAHFYRFLFVFLHTMWLNFATR